MADLIHRRDRAASNAGRLAAGVDSGVVLSRSTACRVGAIELADQSESGLAQRGRVLGCAVDAKLPLGGRDVSRHSLWHTDDAESAGLYSGCRAGVGVGDRRKHRNLECSEWLYPASAARGKANGITDCVLGQ